MDDSQSQDLSVRFLQHRPGQSVVAQQRTVQRQFAGSVVEETQPLDVNAVQDFARDAVQETEEVGQRACHYFVYFYVI